MDMASSLILVANPGSASRKYALYRGDNELAGLHFEWEQDKIICSLHVNGQQQKLDTTISDIKQAASQLMTILQNNQLLGQNEHIEKIGLRTVAPSSYFLEDHIVDDTFISKLEHITSRAPIHITATLQELHLLRSQFSHATIVGVSDSAFHASKPDYAWNYGIPLEDADTYEIKRFGYHGLSVASAVKELRAANKLPRKLIVCHLGSGASITAVLEGKSVDNTMGYSPLEGMVMSTRSGNIDPTAVRALKDALNLDDHAAEDYLNNHSGLLGLGGSADIRELLKREQDGDNRSRLALATYTYNAQKAIAQMTVALGGVDTLVFAGTVGERSAPIRERIIGQLHYLGLVLDPHANHTCESPEAATIISQQEHSKPIIVLPTKESAEIVQRIHRMT